MSVNKKSIRVDLSTESIEKTIKRLKLLEKGITEELPEKITMKLAKAWIANAQKRYASAKFQPQDPIKFLNIKTKKGRRVGVASPGILYTEYGTGTEGENSPHPDKPSNLNDYNSGKTIRTFRREEGVSTPEGTTVEKGDLYWTYKDEGGDIQYTKGVPAGKQVYMTNNYIRRNKSKIIKEAVGEILSKV